MIYTQYKVEVEIPEEVWVNFGHTTEYEQMIIKATKGNNEAGSDRYSKVYEWAIFNDEDKAIRCEEKLEKLIVYFQNKLAEKEVYNDAQGNTENL